MNIHKKILITVTNSISYDQRMLKTARTLQKNGFEVCIIGREIKGLANLPIGDIKHIRFKLLFSTGILFYLEFNLRLFVFLFFQNFDILVAVDLDTVLPCIAHSKIRQKKIILDSHEVFPEVPELKDRKFKKWIWQKVEQFAFKYSNNIYSVSTSISNYYFQKYKKNIATIYNFPIYKINYKEVSNNFNQPILIYQGDLNEGRGLENLIDAMQYIDAQCWIIGKGILENLLIERAKQLKLSNKVLFFGALEPRELEEITSKATIGINFLENKGLSYYFSAANKFFDYAMAGIPCITMDFPEYKLLLQSYKTAITISNLNIREILNAIDSLSNESNYLYYQKNCEIASKIWNWNSQEEKLLNLYNDILV